MGVDEAGRTRLRVMSYEVREDAVAAVHDAVRAVVAALDARGAAGTYLSTQVHGTSSFAHVLHPAVEAQLRDLPEFAAFQELLRGVLVSGPVARELVVVAGGVTALAATASR